MIWLILGIIGFFVFPFIISFIIAAFYCKEMPREERRPASIRDFYECMFFDGHTDTEYSEYMYTFAVLRVPLIGPVIVIFVVLCLFICLFSFIWKLIKLVPGVNIIKKQVINMFNKIINYRFR